jgi:hypothetical protein
VVLTAGTFLAGPDPCRAGEPLGRSRGRSPSRYPWRAAQGTALPQGRLKTGTPPRLDGRSIDFSVMQVQPGDDPVPVFSFSEAGPCTRAACRAGSPTPTSARTTSSAEISIAPDVHGRHRRRRAALLSVDRGQDPPFRGQGQSQDLPRARGARNARDLSERDLDFSCPSTSSLRRAQHTRAGECAHPAPRLRDRVRLLRSAQSEEQLETKSIDGCSSRARSTARPATRRPRRRACSPGSMPRCRCRAGTLVPAARRGLSRRARGRPDHARCLRALPHVHERAPSIGCSCARTMPTCA